MDALDELLVLVEGSSLVERSSRRTGSWLAPGVRTWLASPEQGLTAGLESVSGPPASVAALARLAPSRLTVVATARSERTCWAEVARHGDAGPETCFVNLRFGPAGHVSRLVWLRAPLVPPSEAEAGDAAPDGRSILEAYFAALMASRFREAAAHFSADTLYSHPPYAGGDEWVLFRGRDALMQGFESQRGPSPARQIITDLCQRGTRVFVEGVIEGIPDGGTFFSTAEINPAGEIARYVAFYSATRIPRV